LQNQKQNRLSQSVTALNCPRDYASHKPVMKKMDVGRLL